MNILGISCFYHDAAAALVRDGVIVAAASEEAFSREKHDPALPKQAVAYCLQEGGISLAEVDHVVFYDKPFVKFERLLKTALSAWPRGFVPFMKAMPLWLNQKLWMPQELEAGIGWEKGLSYSEHHLSHAASAFYPSPFEEAAILTVDGVGEWATTSMGVGRGQKIQLTHEIHFPHSLGLIYSAFTAYLGFKVNSAEYKVMGLAPYGEPSFRKQFDEILQIAPDGSFRLNMRYFCYDYALTMTTPELWALFGGPPRGAEEPLTQRHKDIAASLQAVVDEVMVRLATSIVQQTGLKKLCLAGGVALNCVANGHILRRAPVDDLWIQPAASDAGGALGAALFLHHHVLGQPRMAPMTRGFLGPGFTDAEAEAYLQGRGAVYRRLDREDLLEHTCRLIEARQVVGWFQGRMEFGPRALGNRSILGDPRVPEMRDTINLKIKFRESFRPFAPSILVERVSEWFELDRPSPWMLLVAQVREDHRTIPAVTHVDGSARIQTVDRDSNPLYYDLLSAWERRTGCPVLINTSFNVRGEPIVMSPQHAYECFMRTHMDHLILGPFVMDKKEQPDLPGLKPAEQAFKPD